MFAHSPIPPPESPEYKPVYQCKVLINVFKYKVLNFLLKKCCPT